MSQLLKGIKNIFILLVLINITPSLVIGIKKQYFSFLTPQTHIGQLALNSSIESSEWYADKLRNFFQDTRIKGILLKIESPGGVAGSCEALFSEIQNLKKQFPKPIITLTENTCTSGAYQVACATDYIIASPSSLIGGIGARFPTFFNVKKCLQQWNIESQTITAGSYKGVASPCDAMTEEQKVMLQNLAQNTYEQFAHNVAVTRKLSFAQKETWADGQLFTGQQALKIGLVDELGSYTAMLKKIHTLAPIEGEIVWIKPEDTAQWLGWFDVLKKSFHNVIQHSLVRSLTYLSMH